MKLCKPLRDFFFRYEMQWEVFMIVLAVVFVIIGFLPDIISFSEDGLTLLDTFDTGITLFFALEFIVRFSVSLSRKDYLKLHWVDLVALFPVARWLRIARVARVFRLLRLVRIVRVLNSLDRLGVDVARFARLNGLHWMFLVLTIIMLGVSGLLFLFEYRVNDKIQTYWDALYAALITWTTPGYGDIVPVTASGRVSGLVLIISGLIAWGIFIANLSAFLSSRMKNSSDPGMRALQQKLATVDHLDHQELISLRSDLNTFLDQRIAASK